MKRSLISLLMLCGAIPAIVAAPASEPGGKPYTAAIVIEPSTGRVLFEDNAHTPLPTASMAKMMTLLIAMEQIDNGQLKLDTPVTISARASKEGGSQIFAKEGQVFPVQTLLATIMIQSANDSAEAIAEKIAGSAEAFADLMNQRAQKLGLRESTYYDPHGLPNRETGKDDVMSAHDLAVLGIELMKYPLMRQYAAMPSMPFTNGTFTSGLTNPNHLLKMYDGATGIKTGYSAPAGFCVTASAHRGNMDLVCVVMGAKQEKGPQGDFDTAARLMNSAFIDYRLLDVVHRGQTVGQALVTDGVAKSVAAAASGDAHALVKRGEEGSVQVSFSGSAGAPVHKGQPVGTVLVKQAGKVIARLPAVASADVEKEPAWRKFWPF